MVRPVQELVGFQNPVTVNVAPETVMTAPPPVTVPLHFFEASFNWNLSPPGVPRRVSFGEKVAFPVTFLHDTLPAAVMAKVAISSFFGGGRQAARTWNCECSCQ